MNQPLPIRKTQGEQEVNKCVQLKSNSGQPWLSGRL